MSELNFGNKDLAERLGELEFLMREVRSGQQRIERILRRDDRKLDEIMATKQEILDQLDVVIDDVKQDTTLVGSVKTFVEGLKTQLDDALAGASPEVVAKVKIITDGLVANHKELADAIVVNTPVVNPTARKAGS
jgi:hypothetical protein